MAHVTASQARQRFSRLLDAVEQGEEVVVERRGVRFRLIREEHVESTTKAESPLIIEDPDILSGNWTWTPDPQGNLQFQTIAEQE